MRTELFRYYWMLGAIWNFILGMFVTGFFILEALKDHSLLERAGFGLFIAIGASLTIYAGAFPWLRKRSKTRPLIIIDVVGLWSRRDGLMPWSEIQSIEWKEGPGRGDVDIIVVWRRERYALKRWGWLLMDGNGKYWGPRRIYNELKACWERNRCPSGISAESDQVAPS